MQFDRVGIDLAKDVLEVIGVKADLQRFGAVFCCQFLGRGAVIGRCHRQRDTILIQPDFDRAGFLRRDGRHPVNAGKQQFRIDLEQLVIPGRDHTAVIREGAIDQLAGQHHPAFTAHGEADLARRQVDQHVTIERFFKQFAQFTHGFARHDHIGHPGGAFGPRQGEARKPVAIGGGGFQQRFVFIGHVQENAVEVIARFLGRNREAGAVDQFRQHARGQFKTGRQVAFDDHREIITRQGRQLEVGTARLDLKPVVAGGQADLTAFGQLARNIEQQMRRHGDRACLFDRRSRH